MAAAITSGVLAVGTAGYQIYQGEQRKKQAKADMNEYERADLENAFENIQVSTIGSDLAREELQRGSASVVDALQQGGSRMVTAGLPRVQSALISGTNEARSYLDNQVQTRDRLIAQDNVNLRGVRENRDIQNLSAISSEYNAGNQDVWNGILGVASGAMSVGRSLDDSNLTDEEIQQKAEAKEQRVENRNARREERRQNRANATNGNNQVASYDASSNIFNPYMTYDPLFGSDGRNFVTQGTYNPFV